MTDENDLKEELQRMQKWLAAMDNVVTDLNNRVNKLEALEKIQKVLK